MNDSTSAPRSQGAAGSGAVFLTATGLVTAFGAAACCGLPIVLAGLGLGSAWLIAPASLAFPYLTVLLVIAPLVLAGGAVLLWKQSSATCTSRALCAYPAVRIATLLCLLLGTALVYLGYAYLEA